MYRYDLYRLKSDILDKLSHCTMRTMSISMQRHFTYNSWFRTDSQYKIFDVGQKHKKIFPPCVSSKSDHKLIRRRFWHASSAMRRRRLRFTGRSVLILRRRIGRKSSNWKKKKGNIFVAFCLPSITVVLTVSAASSAATVTIVTVISFIGDVSGRTTGSIVRPHVRTNAAARLIKTAGF